jgi:hypothetical protein
MFKIDWGAIRAYASPLILTIIALIAVWKDEKEYKKRAHEGRKGGLVGTVKRNFLLIVYGVTIVAFFLGVLDIHSTRHQAIKDKSDAQAEKSASEKQIKDLETVVKTGNDLLGQQRKDFLEQFSEMSSRVTELESSIKTADLREEAAQLRTDLESTRKTMEIPKATLSFSFAQDSESNTNLINLNIANGVVHVPFTIINGSDADALEGSISLRVCDGCKIVGDPDGYQKIAGEDDRERSMSFQHIFANSKAPRSEVSITPPAGADAFQVGIVYRCRTCVLIKGGLLPANDLGTVILGPHWKPSLMPKQKLFFPKGK